MPWGYVSPLISKHNPLKGLEDWVAPAYASHDISLHTFLEKQGATDSIIQLAVDTNCIYDRSAHDVSTLMPFHGDIRRKFRQRKLDGSTSWAWEATSECRRRCPGASSAR